MITKTNMLRTFSFKYIIYLTTNPKYSVYFCKEYKKMEVTMLEQSNFTEMKQISVGKDEEKVKARLRDEWLPLTKPQREDVLSLSGLTSYAVTRSYEKGRISLKLTLALAQFLHINPYYLAGASDERDLYSDELVTKFLADNGHADLVVKDKPKRKYQRKAKPEAEAVEAPVPEEPSPEPVVEAAESFNEEEETEAVSETVSEETASEETASTEETDNSTDINQDELNNISYKSAKKLLKALFMRAKHSADANATAYKVKALLLK
jgi:hypothetical protein